MTDNAAAIFDDHAARYNEQRRMLIPCFERFYGCAVEAVGLFGNRPARVLDLGAGTGMLSAQIAATYPEARFVLQDGAPAMLAQAKATLGDRVEAVVQSDLAEPLPAGPFDAVVSSLAIHHVSDEIKRAVYSAALRALRPGGIFVNAEHLAGETPEIEAENMAWHEREARRLGASDEVWQDALDRIAHDVRTPLGPQLHWLRDAGFEHVHPLMKDHGFGVMAARRPS